MEASAVILLLAVKTVSGDTRQQWIQVMEQLFLACSLADPPITERNYPKYC